MDWTKLKLDHYHDQPVEHICITSLIDTNTYDRLYENQKDLNHQSWQEFKEKHNTNCFLRENLSDINLNNDVIWLWFFKERSDQTASYVHIKGKQIRYRPNVFLISKCKDFKFVQASRKYIRSPFVQLDMNVDDYNKILKRFNKTT
jgi:hypothetical protein